MAGGKGQGWMGWMGILELFFIFLGPLLSHQLAA